MSGCSFDCPEGVLHKISKETGAVELKVPQGKYYGIKTLLCRKYFNVGGRSERMPPPIIRAFGFFKKAAAEVNKNYGLDSQVADAICQAAEEVLDGTLWNNFPLVVWQPCSGIHTNINVNEVIANRAAEILDKSSGSNHPITEEHVNKNQSSLDVFSIAMHIALVIEIAVNLLPSLFNLLDALRSKEKECNEKIKPEIHMEDVVRLAMEKEFGDYVSQLNCAIEKVETCLKKLVCIPLDHEESDTLNNGTLKNNFGDEVIEKVADITEIAFSSSIELESSTLANGVVLETSEALKNTACSLMKIANGIIFLSSGLERIGDFCENELEDDMACVVDPLHCEIISTVAAQVVGNHIATTIGSKSSFRKKNVYKPMMINNILHSIKLISESSLSFSNNCVKEITINV